MINLFKRFLNLFDKQVFMSEEVPSTTPLIASPVPATAVLPVEPIDGPTPTNPDGMYSDWSARSNARHNVRAICDLVGLTLEQKNILTACVDDESGFLTNPRPNRNKLSNGTIWSTDWGIVQVNDYWNIGPYKPFPSVQYVLDNPAACVRWMAEYYKTNGNLGVGSSGWASYTSGVYKNYL